MIGRPKNFDRHVALQAATDLFWRRGYAATSLEDLLTAMSLSKSSFYSEFTSKEVLFRACLRDYQQMIISDVKQLRSEVSSLRDFLNAIFEKAIEDAASSDPRGCLIVNSAVEFAQHSTRFSKDVRVALKAVQTVFQSAIQKEVRDGGLVINSSPKLLSEAITTLLSGVRTMIKGGMRPNVAKKVAQKLLGSIFT